MDFLGFSARSSKHMWHDESYCDALHSNWGSLLHCIQTWLLHPWRVVLFRTASGGEAPVQEQNLLYRRSVRSKQKTPKEGMAVNQPILTNQPMFLFLLFCLLYVFVESKSKKCRHMCVGIARIDSRNKKMWINASGSNLPPNDQFFLPRTVGAYYTLVLIFWAIYCGPAIDKLKSLGTRPIPPQAWLQIYSLDNQERNWCLVPTMGYITG